MTIYNPFHSIGLFSVFETELIRSADVYTGGYNADYGGRISSMMDITYKDGNKKRFSGSVGASTFGARALIEGPISKQKSPESGSASFVLSFKNSSHFLNQLFNNSENFSSLEFVNDNVMLLNSLLASSLGFLVKYLVTISI